jgi:hypothetical protein
MPGYWMSETSGRLRPVIEAYLTDKPLTSDDIAALRSYLRQWIEDPCWQGPAIDQLRASIDGLTSRPAIERWLDTAIDHGIDPL